MSTASWRRAKALFQAALDVPTPQREAFVRAHGQSDAEIGEVLQLVRMHESPDFLQSPIEGGLDKASAEPELLTGHDVGGFRIKRRLGAGGMGTVYEAEQAHPRRMAAVKVLRHGFSGSSALRRFEYEAEALGRLDHPGIARVYAAGTFDLGSGAQPWLAMELIDGKPLNAYVAETPVPRARKLELCLAICNAVQHAHQRGVIHRDLKPANILVTPTGQPKIVDFGVARSIDSASPMTQLTVAGELVGTLSYMSPEQLGGDPERVDARSDVYALGAIGYELLGGRSPHEGRGSSIGSIIRAIEETEPPRLGTIDPACRGDLEIIFSKALEKDRDRRYQSVAELAADLRRHLNDEPVLARPATVVYQLRKFARRHRPLAFGVAASIIALAVGMVLYAIEARHARQEADRSKYEADKATAINNFITNDFLMKFLAAAHAGDTDRRLPVAELVNQAAERVEAMYAGQPLAEAAVRNEVGTIYYNIGAFDRAAGQFERSLALWEAGLGPDHVDTLKAVNNLAQSLAHLRRTDRAERLYRRALAGRLRALGEEDPFTLVSMNNLAAVLRETRPAEAEVMLRQALAIQQRVHGVAHKNTLTTMSNLGLTLLDLGQTDEAARLHRTVHELSEQTYGADHIATLVAASRLGGTLHQIGAHAEARRVLERTLERLDRTLGPQHLTTIATRRSLARLHVSEGRFDTAADQLMHALEAARATPGVGAALVQEILEELDAAHAAAAPP
jgi:eukaryotic-like serine/threonine-protein kinase